jgi:hypothetical protein
MGTSPVTLFRDAYSSSQAFALCGSDACRLSYHTKTQDIIISNIWLTDSSNPGFPHPQLSAICSLPPRDPRHGYIACTDGSTLRTATFVDAPKVVPRRIPLQKHSTSPLGTARLESMGTPQRLLFSQRLNALVIGSAKFEHKMASNNYWVPKPPWTGMRVCRGILQFMPLGSHNGTEPGGDVTHSDVSTFIELLPAERILSMTEWTFRHETRGYYYYLLVGTRVEHRHRQRTGRLLFFLPRTAEDGSIKVELRRIEPMGAPVRALAVYESKIILSGDKSISVCELSELNGR